MFKLIGLKGLKKIMFMMILNIAYCYSKFNRNEITYEDLKKCMILSDVKSIFMNLVHGINYTKI